MKKKLNLLILCNIAACVAMAQEQGIDQKIDQFFGKATGWYVEFLFGTFSIPILGVDFPVVVLWLIVGALFCTLYFGFVNIRKFFTSINIIRGKYDDEPVKVEASTVHVSDGDVIGTIKDESAEGEVSHFQALTAALSGTVGLGNIAGVAVAISIGGPGATFWMICAGLLGMASKFTECTLGVKYREVDETGKVYGGPMYYLSKGLQEKGLAGLGKFLAVVFALFCIAGSFGGGNMFQANQAFKMLEKITMVDGVSAVSGYGWLFGVLLAVLVAIVIIGGIKSIAKVTDKVVPFMVGIYVFAVLAILFINVEFIPKAFVQIFDGAFNAAGIAGGIVGVIFQGFKRAAFSNEAGVGSASIAHSAVRTKYPASEGLVALMEPFIDTVVVCTMTALLLIISNMDGSIMSYGTAIPDGVEATSAAFERTIPWFPYVLAVAVILFAFSTMISWSYYGMQAWSYLFGKGKINEIIYKALFCIFIVVGASASLGAVIDFSDAMILSMAFPNFVGLFLLAPIVRKELKKYLEKIRSIDQQSS